MANRDDDLLARLRNLKPQTTIRSLNPNKVELGSENTDEGSDQSALSNQDDLSARFGRLRPSAGPPTDMRAAVQNLNSDDLILHNAVDDDMITQLLNDVKSGSKAADYKVGRSDLRDADLLVQQGNKLLDQSKAEDNDNRSDREDNHNSDETSQNQIDEDAEAEAYIRQALEEADHEPDTDGEQQEQRDRDEDEGSPKPSVNQVADEHFEFPSIPANAPVAYSVEDSTDTDDVLFPAAPSDQPKSEAARKTDNASKFSDDEIETWCIICNDDATLMCRGCGEDDNLYCHTCWIEGHRSEDSSFEERSHKAVAFVKGDRKKQQAQRARKLAA